MNKQILIPKTKLTLNASEKATIRQVIPNLTDRDWRNIEKAMNNKSKKAQEGYVGFLVDGSSFHTVKDYTNTLSHFQNENPDGIILQ